MTAPLTDSDRRAILALLDAEISSTPSPRNLSPVGCLAFVVAVGLFFSLSVLTRRWAVSAPIRSLLFVLIVLGMIGGLGLVFFGGGSGESRARAAANGALDHLTRSFHQSSSQQNFDAAVRLLRNAYYSGGPWMVSTIDIDGARERLEQAGVLVWMRQIEEFLVAEKRAQPVFTLEASG